jgi:hypothetical protein
LEGLLGTAGLAVLRPVSGPLAHQPASSEVALATQTTSVYFPAGGTGRHSISLLPGAAVVLTVWALVTSLAFPPEPWPPCSPPHALARPQGSEVLADTSERELLGCWSSDLDQPLLPSCTWHAAEPRDGPSVSPLPDQLVSHSGQAPSAMLAL